MENNVIRKGLSISDSHMRTDCVLQAIKREKPDMFIQLGDIEDDPYDIHDYLNV